MFAVIGNGYYSDYRLCIPHKSMKVSQPEILILPRYKSQKIFSDVHGSGDHSCVSYRVPYLSDCGVAEMPIYAGEQKNQNKPHRKLCQF
jgi:hypothetical protein